VFYLHSQPSLIHSVRTAGLCKKGEQNNVTECVVWFWRVCAGPSFYQQPKSEIRIILFHLSVPQIHNRKAGYHSCDYKLQYIVSLVNEDLCSNKGNIKTKAPVKCC
jgi:hypothetical protein